MNSPSNGHAPETGTAPKSKLCSVRRKRIDLNQRGTLENLSLSVGARSSAICPLWAMSIRICELHQISFKGVIDQSEKISIVLAIQPQPGQPDASQ